MTDRLFDRAYSAFYRTAQIDPGRWQQPPTPTVALWRAELARDLVAVLGVDPARVTVTDDPRRDYGGVAGQLLTVDLTDTPAAVNEALAQDPYGENHTRGIRFLLDTRPPPVTAARCTGLLRFIPFPGFTTLFGLLGTCPRCGTRGVAVAAIAQLVDLSAWAVMGEAADNGLRFALDSDPLHEHCPIHRDDEHATDQPSDPAQAPPAVPGVLAADPRILGGRR